MWKKKELAEKEAKYAKGDIVQHREFWDTHWMSITVISITVGLFTIIYGLITFPNVDGLVSLAVGIILSLVGSFTLFHGIGAINLNKF